MTTSRFPHLKDANAWPGLRTVDPFALQVSFDPYLWGPDVVIHLCKTRLDAEYQNVGGWETAAARDAWFDSRAEREFRLESEFHVLPGSEIKLPIAFEVLNHYNQLFIDFPPTSTEDGSNTSTRYYFFISDVQYRSPSSTACIITVDEWSTHMFDIDMEYIDLDRGHAPMAEVSSEEYLANPLSHADLLTAPDVDFGHSSTLSWTAETILNRGPHWLVLSMTSDPFQSTGTIGDPNNWRTPSTHNLVNQGALSQSIFAIDPADAVTFLDAMDAQAPQLISTLQAVFLIPRRYLTINGSFQIFGITCRTIEQRQVLENVIELSEQMFGYDSKYENIAKLYTSPYAWLEMTDETGRVQRILVEETTGRIKLAVVASILYPLIGIDAQVTGVGNSGTRSLTWDNLTSHTFESYGDWTRGLRQWNVPTFIVTQNAEKTYDWSQYWQRNQATETNTRGYQLALDTNATNLSMRGAALDRQAARLVQQQNHDSAQRTLSQNTAYDVLDENREKISDDWQAEDVIAQVMKNQQIQQLALSMNQVRATNDIMMTKASMSQAVAAEYRDYVQVSGRIGLAQSQTGAISNLAQSTLGTAAAGMSGDGLGIAQQGINLASGVVSDVLDVQQTYQDVSYNNYSATMGANLAMLDLEGARISAHNVEASIVLNTIQDQQAYTDIRRESLAKLVRADEHAVTLYNLEQGLENSSLALRQQYQTAISNDDIALIRSQAATSKALSDRAATQAKDLQDLSLANARRAARLAPPKLFTAPSGRVDNYTRPQAFIVNVKTEDPGAIAAAGDYFLRYGYALSGRQWRVTSLNVMGHFTFWKGEPRFGADSINEVTRGILSAMFREGTFVWRNPDDIGSISIYDN